MAFYTPKGHVPQCRTWPFTISCKLFRFATSAALPAAASLLPAEVGGYVAPLARVPLYDGHAELMRPQPRLGALDYLVQPGSLGVKLKLGLALHLPDPRYGREAVAVDCLSQSFLFHQGQGVHYGEELADVVSAEYGPVMEHLRARGEVDAAVLHLARITAARRVYGQCVGAYFHRKRKNRVVAVIGRIDVSVLHGLVGVYAQ